MSSQRPLSILMVSLVDFAAGEGGANHQLGLLRAWRRQGHRVLLVAPRNGGGPGLEPADLRHIVFSSRISTLGLPRILDALPQLARIAAARIRRRADVLYVRANALSFLQILLARAMGMVAVVEHNSWLAAERRMRGGGALACAVERRFQVWSARLAHFSRCVTPGIRDLLRESGMREAGLFVVGNGTDVGRFMPLDRDEALAAVGLDPARTWLGFIGILSRWQGVETAIAALAELRDRPEVSLVVAGDGPERLALERLAQQLALGERVVFLGQVDRNRANQVVNAFEVGLAPFTRRRNEAIGLSALKLRDYAAAGTVVVASDIAGVRELAREGWLVTHKPDDPADLARVLREVLADRDALAAKSRAARAYAERHFGWGPIAADILREIGCGGGAGAAFAAGRERPG